jgi:hypothetical protein
MIPAWYLVAVNLATGRKVLLGHDRRVMDIVEFSGTWAIVPGEDAFEVLALP